MTNLQQTENKMERVLYFFPPNHFDRNMSKEEFYRQMLEAMLEYRSRRKWITYNKNLSSI